MQKNIKIGLAFIISPILGFLAVLILWALVAFGASSFMETAGARTVLWFGYINMALGLLGLISLVATPVCLIIGLVFMLKKDATQAVSASAGSDESPLQPAISEVQPRQENIQ